MGLSPEYSKRLKARRRKHNRQRANDPLAFASRFNDQLFEIGLPVSTVQQPLVLFVWCGSLAAFGPSDCLPHEVHTTRSSVPYRLFDGFASEPTAFGFTVATVYKPADFSIKGSHFAFMFCPLLYRLLDRAGPDF